MTEAPEEKTVADLEAEGRTPEQALKVAADAKGVDTVGRDTQAIKDDIAAAEEE